MPTSLIIIITIAALLLCASLVYGFIRRFTRMSWIAWQLPIVFAITRLLRLVPVDTDPMMQFVFGLVTIVGATVLVLGGTGLIRLAMLKKAKPVSATLRVFDRLLGSITALLDYAVLVLFFASLALPILNPASGIVPDMGLGAIFEISLVANYATQHAFDFFLVTVFVLALRSGWRVGFMRTLVIWIMLALTFAAIAFSFYATLQVEMFATIASKIAGQLTGIHALFAQIIGVSIVALILFAVMFTIICFIFYFVVKLIRNIRHSYFWGTIDGVIGAVLGFAVALVLTLAVGFAFQLLGSGMAGDLISSAVEGIEVDGLQEILSAIVEGVKEFEGICAKIATVFTSPLFSGKLFSIYQMVMPA